MTRHNITHTVIATGFDATNCESMLKERSRCHFTAPRVNREKHTNLMTVRVGDMLIVKTFLYKLVYTLQETVHFNLKSISRLLT